LAPVVVVVVVAAAEVAVAAAGYMGESWVLAVLS
jgi:hypothetical protein